VQRVAFYPSAIETAIAANGTKTAVLANSSVYFCPLKRATPKSRDGKPYLGSRHT